jgi:hypothetical protein
MRNSGKLGYLVAIFGICCIQLLLCNTATGAEVNGFPTGYVCNSSIAITYVDADGDPSTGAWVGGVWYPNETQVAVYHIQGDLSMDSNGWFFSYAGTNCGETGWESKSGIVVMRFIDVMAPGWVWNDPSTWQGKKINSADFSWSHDLCANWTAHPTPYITAKAYENFEMGGSLVAQFSNICPSTGCYDSGTKPFESASGFSEIVFTTYFCENTIASIEISADPPPELPTISVTATDNTATEAGPTSGTFRISRTGSTASSLSVYLTMSGTATNGTDYSTISSPVTIAAAASYVDITRSPINDTACEGDETMVLRLSSNSAYLVGSPSSATITIVDNDCLPTVTIVATDNTATEAGPTTGTFTISRTGSTAASLTVYYSVGGTSTAGSDRNGLSGNVVIAAGSSSGTVVITPINDTLVEGNETVILTLGANAAYTVGSPSNATITIIDND